MTTKNPAKCPPSAFPETVSLNHRNGILAARRRESTRPTEQWTDPHLVTPHQKDRELSCHRIWVRPGVVGSGDTWAKQRPRASGVARPGQYR
jgi:hypothetical protein